MIGEIDLSLGADLGWLNETDPHAIGSQLLLDCPTRSKPRQYMNRRRADRLKRGLW
jgi:hypothetical protein